MITTLDRRKTERMGRERRRVDTKQSGAKPGVHLTEVFWVGLGLSENET
jgi:hypothetical protein